VEKKEKEKVFENKRKMQDTSMNWNKRFLSPRIGILFIAGFFFFFFPKDFFPFFNPLLEYMTD